MTAQLTFNLASGSVAVNFTTTAANELLSRLKEIVSVLKTKTATVGDSSVRTVAKSIEYQYTGDIFLEVFCNPNIWANPFVAKVFISLRDDRIRLSSEVALTQIIEDVERFLE